MNKHIGHIALIAAVAALGSVAYHSHSHQQVIPPSSQQQPAVVTTGRVGPAEIYPDSSKTPGAPNPDVTQANISQNICNPKWSTKSIRPPATYTTNLKVQQLGQGYTYQGDMNTKDYEEDHLVSLELGGNPTDPKNLWPEPYHTTLNGSELGAKQKDTVENYLHKQVCAGAVSLLKAQQAISTDWYAIYLTIQ